MIDEKEYALIKNIEDNNQWFSMKLDSINRKITLKNYKDTLEVFDLKYTKVDSLFSLQGTVRNDSVFINLKRTVDYKKRFLLTNRGFNWINEYPFNR